VFEALKARWHSGERLHLAVGTSVALHLALAALLNSLPAGSLGGSRAASWAGGHGMRAVLRPTSLPESAAPSMASMASAASRSDFSDQPPAERQVKASSAAQARAGGPTDTARAGMGPDPDTYTTVETRTVVHAPISNYYTVGDLDIRPWIAMQVEPEYPDAAAHRFMSGKVVIRVLINELGKVDRTVVVSSEPQGFFEIPAQNAFNAARYTPGVKLGKAVKSQLTIEVTFTSAGPPKIVEQQAR
jgi:TonB family protein